MFSFNRDSLDDQKKEGCVPPCESLGVFVKLPSVFPGPLVMAALYSIPQLQDGPVVHVTSVSANGRAKPVSSTALSLSVRLAMNSLGPQLS